MSDIPKKNNDSERASDIDLAMDINPELYSAANASRPSHDKFYVYRAAEKATAQADDQASKQDGSKGFVTAKADGAMAGIYDWVKCIVFAIAIVVVCLTFVFRLVDVEGTSMNDTLDTNDKVIVTNMMYTPHNNDIVVISHGAEYEKPIIKRALPFLSNHLSKEEGVIGTYLRLNKNLEPSIQVRFAEPMTADRVWELMNMETWTITYSKDDVREMPAKMKFDKKGTCYEYQ